MLWRKILLVDDDTDDKDIIQDAMQAMAEPQVMSFADNGEHALKILDQDYGNQELPCLIVLDLNMPKMNGTQTLEHLKSDDRFKDIPVIIYSTSINPIEQKKCVQLGAHAYVSKPVSLQESLQIGKKFLEYCSDNQQPKPSFSLGRN